MISKNFQKYPLRVHTHARVPHGSPPRFSRRAMADLFLWGASGINPAAGQKPRFAKKPVRIAQALQKVI